MTKRTERIADELRRALRGPKLVWFTTRFERMREHGYIRSVGDGLFLLEVVDGTMRFDGFVVYRVQDVREFAVDEPARARFVEAALAAFGESRSVRPAVRLRDLRSVLSSLARLDVLVAFHRQRVDPDTCSIGKILSVGEHHVEVLEIDPDAQWEEETSRFRLNQLTRLDFGGGYERALELVGGPPPASSPPAR